MEVELVKISTPRKEKKSTKSFEQAEEKPRDFSDVSITGDSIGITARAIGPLGTSEREIMTRMMRLFVGAGERINLENMTLRSFSHLH